MRQVQLHEEEHHFAALVSEAEAGESMTILRGDKPVAQLIPAGQIISFPQHPTELGRAAAPAEPVKIMDPGLELRSVWDRGEHDSERVAAHRELMAILREGIPMGGIAPTRDEMHER